MDNLPINAYLCVGIVLAFVFNSRRELLGGRPANPDDDGSESLLWFLLCSSIWPLMVASVVYAKVRQSRLRHH